MLVDTSKTVETKKYKSALTEDIYDFDRMLNDACSEIEFYDWCLEIRESFVGLYFTGVVGVFLFYIKPAYPVVDEWVWVVVGDLPHLYITCEESPNAACALDSYIGAMQEWVEAAKLSMPVDNLVPVNLPATPENAAMLESRLKILDERVLSLYEEDLKA